MLKELQDIGLSEKEAKVYMAALEIGRATADQLAKHSGIVRSTTYVQLESLMKKGLMSTYEEGKKTFFAPESPEHLKRIFYLKKKEFEVREKELSDFLPELLRTFEGAGERPRVRFFDGKEGVQSIREEALKAKDKQISFLYSFSKFKEIFTKEEREDYSRRRAEKGIHTRVIYTSAYTPEPDYVPPPLTAAQYMNEKDLTLNSDIFIYDEKVAFIVLEGRPHGVVMESKGIVSTMKQLFDHFWKVGEGNIKYGPGAK